MTTLYFTGTGNSLYVAKRIGGELYSIPQMIKEGRHDFEDDVIGFVYPCHGWGAPQLVRDFIRKSTFKADYFYVIMTYGGDAKSGLKQIEQVGKEVEIHFDYANEVLMADNYLPAHEMGHEALRDQSGEIEKHIGQIVIDIENRLKKRIEKGTSSDDMSAKGYKSADGVRHSYALENFNIEDTCNGCKTCEKVCPANNIQVEKAPKFLRRCEMCFACIHLCPQNAIHMETQKSRKRFLNHHIKLNEIIAANNQHDALK